MSDGATSQETLAILKTNLGVTDAEARVLVPVLAGGNMTIGAIALLTGDKTQTIEKTLEGLKRKGLVSRVGSVVPVYRAIPPYLIMGEDLSSVADQTRSLDEVSRTSLDSHDETLAELVQTIKDAESRMSTELGQTLDERDSTLIEEERTSAAGAIESSSGILTSFCEAAESILTSHGESLGESLASQLTDVQSELDRVQSDIETDIKTVNKEFDQEVRREHDTSSQAIGEFGKSAKTMVQQAKASVKGALQNSLSGMRQATVSLSDAINSRLSEIVNEAASEMAASSDELSRSLEQIILELNQTDAETRASLSSLVSNSREAASGIAMGARQTIENAMKVTESLSLDIGAWSEESANSIASASEGLAAQLAQTVSSNAGCLNGLKEALSKYMTQTNSTLDKAFAAIDGLFSSAQGQIESFSAETRASMLKLVQAQAFASRERIEGVGTSLGAALDKWATDTIRTLQRKLSQAGSEVGIALEAETKKLSSLTGELGNKLRSSFGSVLTMAVETDKLTVAGARKTFREFETGMADKLTEIVSDFTSAVGAHIQESTTFYHGMRSSLDSRLEQSVTSVASHAERMQKQIDEAIEDQTARIERHTEAIKKDFHTRLDEIAKQHSDLAESLNSALGGLLSSQGLETRDLIISAQTQFRNAVRAEITSLQDDSAKLEKDYASEIEGDVTRASASYDAMKKALDDLIDQRRSGFSRSMADTLSRIESTTTDIETGLRGIESGTIQEMAADLARVSEEISTTVAVARENLSTRVDGIAESIVEPVTKSTTSMKVALDGSVSAERDAQDRIPDDLSKKLDALATKMVKDYLQRIESSKAEVAAGRREAGTALTAANEETETLLQSQMSGDERTLSETSEYAKSALSTVSSTLTTLTGKATDKIGRMRKNLSGAAENAETALVKRSEVSIVQLEEAATAILERAEGSFKARAADLGSACSASLDKDTTAVSGLPSSVSEMVRTAIGEALTQAESSDSVTLDGLTTEFTGCESASKSVTDGLSLELGLFRDALGKSLGSVLGKTKQSVVSANQCVSEKIDSTRQSIKAEILSSSNSATEKLRNEVSTKVSEISGIAQLLNSQIEESVGRAKDARMQALTGFDQEVGTAAEQWHAEQEGFNQAVRKKTEEVTKGLESVVLETTKAMDTVRAISGELMKAQPESTWYLTGNDEVRAHILDMAQRAQESIVIAVMSVRGLDIKRAPKSSDSVRRVLIIPESEEQQPIVRDLIGQGWHVRKTISPMTLAVMDNKEVIIGGAVETTNPLALVSVDKTYLKLFHDVIGPRLLIRPPPALPQRASSAVQPD